MAREQLNRNTVKIPFNKVSTSGREFDYIKDAIDRAHLSGDGYYTGRCEEILKLQSKVTSAHLTHSCTAALEIAALLADLKPGDEVIMPSYTFVSTANAVVLRGAVPVFVDIDPGTLNIDPACAGKAITAKTKAIIAVHYAGVIADMAAINALAADHNLWVIEDAAQALGSYRDGMPAGSFGHLAAFSFHETKNIISGEGGCLTTSTDELRMRAEIIREKGTNRRAFLDGVVDKYSWVDVGSSYLPSELNAAYLFAQLENLISINLDRVAQWEKYYEAFADLEARNIIQRPKVPDNCQHNGHLFYFILKTHEQRAAFIVKMKEFGITCPFHYVPLHSSDYGKKCSRTFGDLIYTDDLSKRLVRLPIFPNLADKQDYIIKMALDILTNK